MKEHQQQEEVTAYAVTSSYWVKDVNNEMTLAKTPAKSSERTSGCYDVVPDGRLLRGCIAATVKGVDICQPARRGQALRPLEERLTATLLEPEKIAEIRNGVLGTRR